MKLFWFEFIVSIIDWVWFVCVAFRVLAVEISLKEATRDFELNH